MAKETVKKAKADVKKLKANLEHIADEEKKADATRIQVNDADTGASPDSDKKISDTVESIFGIDAGIVWKKLNLNEPMTIDDLVKSTKLNQGEIYGALGWLGRENKILLETRGTLRFFSLKP